MKTDSKNANALPRELKDKMQRLRAQQIGFLVLGGFYQLIEAEHSPAHEVATGDSEMDSVVDAVLAVGRERKQLLDKLRLALNGNKNEDVLALARELCNVQKGDAHGNRSTKAVH